MNQTWGEEEAAIVPLWKRKLIQLFVVGTWGLLAGILIGWQLGHLPGPRHGPTGVPTLVPVTPSFGVDEADSPGRGAR
jgi:hypothetical protein